MAKAARRSSPFGWFIIGVMVGVVLLIAAFVVITRDRAPVAPEPAPAAALPTPGVVPAVPAPVVAVPKPESAIVAPKPPPLSEDAQLAEDAAASGMTGPATPPAEQPTN